MRTTFNKTKHCDDCGNTLLDCEEEQLRSFVSFEKYVPHKYVYRHYCLECLNKDGKSKDLEENGFVEYQNAIMEDEAPENNLLNKAHVSGQVCPIIMCQ